MRRDEDWASVLIVLLLISALILVAYAVAHPGRSEGPAPSPSTARPAPSALPTDSSEPTAPSSSAPAPATRAVVPARVFGDGRFLVAYYGTARTGALGVLGETSPQRMQQRVTRAARPFARPGRPVQVVYELIVTIADRSPGRRRAYSHDIARAEVARYVRVARRHQALLLLDVQPGHDTFPQVARRWAWALRKPWVGLALDPEWRMPTGAVPGQRIGHVSAAEINRTSAWLARLVRTHDLPQKLFVLHQFRVAMIRDIGQVRPHPELAMVQHVDGFGTRREKLATFHAVARPRQFTMGFKLFYDEDVDRMGARAVHAVRPRVRFVSFQ